MKEELGKNYINWLLAICGIFVFLNIDSMWSGSVDLAHHYALAFRISEQWVLTTTSDPTLGEMNIYPRGSHIIAAIFGFFVNSIFLGVQLVTLVSLALLWLSAILILNSLQKKLATISLITFTGLLFLNSAFAKFDLHGHEVVGNFFYSQLVGHSVLFISIVFAIKLEKKFGVICSVVALILLMLLNATIHLLPALEMLGLIFALLFVYVLFDAKSRISINQKITIAIPIALFALVGIFQHPSFSAMRVLSENNGALELKNIQYPYGVILLCILVLLASLQLFLKWIKSSTSNENLAIKYLSIYGGVTATLCLLQFTLTFFGHGSDYTVKKYGFGLASIFLLELSIILGMYIYPFLENGRFRFENKVTPLNAAILMVSISSALYFNVPNQKSLDVSDIVSIERKLINISDTILPSPENKKGNVVIGLDGMPNTINYMFSIAIMKTAHEFAIPDVLIKNDLTDPANYSYIVSSNKNKIFGSADCKSLANNSLSIIAASCFEKKKVLMFDCRSTFDFSVDGAIPNSLLKGFSSPEAHGRWTDGSLAQFHCVNNGLPARILRLYLTPFIYGKLKSQSISISLNGVALGVHELSSAHGDGNPIVINIHDAIDTKEYTLEFKMPDATSPKDIGFNGDERMLGFSFQKIQFE